MKKNRVFGGSFTESLASYDHESSLWKTCQMCFDWGDSTYSEALPKSGMIANGRLYQLNNLAHPTYENDGFVLPTPTAVQMESQERTDRAIQLAKEGKPLYTRRIVNGIKVPERRTFGIKEAIIHRTLLPTPTANEAKNNPRTPSQWDRNASLNVEAAKVIGHTKETIGKDSRLNPHFVQWMMGFPSGWLD